MSAMISSATTDGWPLQKGVGGEEPRRPIAAQVGDDHAVAPPGQQRRDIDETVDVIGPAMQQDDHRPVGGAGLGVGHIEHAGVDLLQRREAGGGEWLGRWLRPGGLRPGGCRPAQLSGGDGQRGYAEKATAVRIDDVEHVDRTHHDSPWRWNRRSATACRLRGKYRLMALFADRPGSDG